MPVAEWKLAARALPTLRDKRPAKPTPTPRPYSMPLALLPIRIRLAQEEMRAANEIRRNLERIFGTVRLTPRQAREVAAEIAHQQRYATQAERVIANCRAKLTNVNNGDTVEASTTGE